MSDTTRRSTAAIDSAAKRASDVARREIDAAADRSSEELSGAVAN